MSFSFRSSLILTLIISLSIGLFVLNFAFESVPFSVVVLNGFIALGVSGILLFLFEVAVIRPLGLIKEAMRQIEQGKNGVQIEEGRFRETREFIRSLNGALRKIQEEKETIEDAKNVLEIRVRARTRELQVLADELEQKVRQRTREAENKVAELERFQRLAVGRELKMVELKSELRRIREQLEKHAE